MAEETPEATQAPAEDLSTSVPTDQAEEHPTIETPPQTEVEAASAPDEIQPFIQKAQETIHHEADDHELAKFLRAHIKTFRQEWDTWSKNAKDVYIHMMTSQFLQRKAAATQIGMGNEFKLPVPSAQTQMFDSIKQSQFKPQKRQPVLLMPPNLRPTYSLKK
jgi:hypothetical protein